MNLPLLIAERTARHINGERPSIMVRVATISVALGVAVVILSLAIIGGFRTQIRSQLEGLTSSVMVCDISSMESAGEPISASTKTEQLIAKSGAVEHFSRYGRISGIIRSDEAVEGLMLKGVDESFDWSFFAKSLVEGTLPRVADSVRHKEILISKGLAAKLALGVGSKVEMMFSDERHTLRRDLFKISGIYSTGMGEMDDLIAVADLRDVQRLKGWGESQISGYEVWLSPDEDAALYAETLNRELLYAPDGDSVTTVATTIDDLYPNIFDWLKAHDVNALVIIIIMLIVAGFNMTTALLIMVLERTRMVGTLKSLGMNNSALQQIFLYRSVRVIAKGLLWGDIAGVGLALIQQHTKLIKLDSVGYMLDSVPIDLGLGWLLMLNAGVVLAIVALMVIPARFVARIEPSDAMRQQ